MKLFLNFIGLLSFSVLYSGEWIGITSDIKLEASIELEQSNIESSVLTFETKGYSINEVETPLGLSSVIGTELTLLEFT